MEENKAGITEKINTYKADVEALVRFLPWLEKRAGEKLSTNYSPEDGAEITMKVPVYDSTLLSFIKAAKQTKFINKNYVYTYSRYKIRNSEDELKLIDRVQIMDIELLGNILSKYVIKGNTKGAVWSEGMENGVYLKLITKMKSLIEYWTKPME